MFTIHGRITGSIWEHYQLKMNQMELIKKNESQTWRGLYGEAASDPYKSHCPVVFPRSSKSKYTLLSPYLATTAPVLYIQQQHSTSTIHIKKKKKKTRQTYTHTHTLNKLNYWKGIFWKLNTGTWSFWTLGSGEWAW